MVRYKVAESLIGYSFGPDLQVTLTKITKDLQDVAERFVPLELPKKVLMNELHQSGL